MKREKERERLTIIYTARVKREERERERGELNEHNLQSMKT